ncbi:hypothetical protein AMTR_s00061p00139570 [Amborella trichopoda]|uniref:Uncharacterized protein n=1 Tax=Amborella trichopoda TaxID=13333 RepID=U5DA87_AMBTC|nr:hypothetical protein AMTR_s00061p00139570 [Amborella trichopoda]
MLATNGNISWEFAIESARTNSENPRMKGCDGDTILKKWIGAVAPKRDREHVDAIMDGSFRGGKDV